MHFHSYLPTERSFCGRGPPRCLWCSLRLTCAKCSLSTKGAPWMFEKSHWKRLSQNNVTTLKRTFFSSEKLAWLTLAMRHYTFYLFPYVDSTLCCWDFQHSRQLRKEQFTLRGMNVEARHRQNSSEKKLQRFWSPLPLSARGRPRALRCWFYWF